MSKIKYLPVILISAYIAYAVGFNIMSTGFTPVTLQQIQTKTDDSLVLGRDKSLLEGDSVEFVARVVAPPRVSPANNDFRTMLRGTNSWTYLCTGHSKRCFRRNSHKTRNKRTSDCA